MSSSFTPKALGNANAVRNAGARFRAGVKRSVQRTALDPAEVQNAEQVWAMQLGTRQNVPTLTELLQLIERLQIPMQPMLRQVVESAYAERPAGQFAFSDFILLLEQCKTLHQRWLHKVRGKHFDDDILEAYIAVGGEPDSTGAVDVSVMQQIASDFHLTLPQLTSTKGKASPPPVAALDVHGEQSPRGQSPQPADTSHHKTLEFNAFVGLLRDGDGACFSNQVYLGEGDLDEDGGDALEHSHSAAIIMHGGHHHPTGHSRRGSLFRRGSMRQSATTPSNAHRRASEQDHPPRSHTSMEASTRHVDHTATAANTGADASPSKGRRRGAASPPPPKSRFPVLGKPKREKKPKFANW